jgi:hypothetical protein
VHQGDQVTILVRVTPPFLAIPGTAIKRVSVYQKSVPPPASPWTLTGTGLQFLPGVLVQPTKLGADVWMAEIETIEGCMDRTAASRSFQVTR